MKDTVRALLNDVDGEVFTDEVLEPFIQEAMNRVPVLAASLAALSRGAEQFSQDLLEWPKTKYETVKQRSIFSIGDEGKEPQDWKIKET